jgi:multimeric flavodoxin WrbA
MNIMKTALLLIGSPKAEKSTSASLGNYLCSKLEESGIRIEKTFLHRMVNREEKVTEFFEMINNADLIILSFPLYVDSLPAPVIKAMELIKEERDKLERKKAQYFVAICNNGFPEASQNMIALQICKIFAKDCGFVWKGGIAVGGGGAINGIPLKEKGDMVRNITNGLDLAANALKDFQEIPQEAIALISKKTISPGLYRTFANFGWRIQIQGTGERNKNMAGKRKKLLPIKIWMIFGLFLLLLGIPVMIFGIINQNTLDLTLGITFSIIGLHLFLFELVVIIVKKKRSNK